MCAAGTYEFSLGGDCDWPECAWPAVEYLCGSGADVDLVGCYTLPLGVGVGVSDDAG